MRLHAGSLFQTVAHSVGSTYRLSVSDFATKKLKNRLHETQISFDIVFQFSEHPKLGFGVQGHLKSDYSANLDPLKRERYQDIRYNSPLYGYNSYSSSRINHASIGAQRPIDITNTVPLGALWQSR